MSTPSRGRSAIKDAAAVFLADRPRGARIREIRAHAEDALGKTIPQSSVRSALQDQTLFLRIYPGLYRLQPQEIPAAHE